MLIGVGRYFKLAPIKVMPDGSNKVGYGMLAQISRNKTKAYPAFGNGCIAVRLALDDERFLKLPSEGTVRIKHLVRASRNIS